QSTRSDFSIRSITSGGVSRRIWLACSGGSRSTASSACLTTLPLSMGDAARASTSTIIPLRSDQTESRFFARARGARLIARLTEIAHENVAPFVSDRIRQREKTPRRQAKARSQGAKIGEKELI